MITYKVHHVNGLFFELSGDEGKNKEYDVAFVDRNGNKTIYETKLKPGAWAKLDRKYFSDIAIFVRYEGRTIKQVNIVDEIKGKRVLISYESKSLGDTLAWLPFCDKFREVYDCKVIVSSFKNFMFEKMYPELEFIPKGSFVENIHGLFELGWFYDKMKEPQHPATIPLQKAASNILNLPFEEIIPKVDFTPKERPIEEKYITISTQSTAQCKYWYYWQELVDILNERGYKVYEISKEEHGLKNVVEFEDKSIENTMNIIHHSEFFIGLSSGLSWMSWALHKKVIMISNFTEPDHEFKINCIRIINHNVCNGCWNKPIFKFNKGDWYWCPEHEHTPRQFECHKEIKIDDVMLEVNKLIN